MYFVLFCQDKLIMNAVHEFLELRDAIHHKQKKKRKKKEKKRKKTPMFPCKNRKVSHCLYKNEYARICLRSSPRCIKKLSDRCEAPDLVIQTDYTAGLYRLVVYRF